MQVRHLNGLRALEATLRLGSFAAAADEIGVTPAAVGQRVRGLESALGIRLFHRTARGAEPTEAARAVAGGLGAAFAGLEQALSALGQSPHPDRLAVTLPASLAENWLARRIGGFHAAHPEADLRLDATNRMVDLASEPLDFALRWAEPAGHGWREDTLFGDWVLPVATPDFARAHALTPTGVRLDGVPLIHLENRTPDPGWADWPAWAAAFAAPGGSLARGPRYTRVGSGLQPALSGQGLVLAGIVEAWDALSEGRLMAPFGFARRLPAGYRYRLVARADRRESPIARRFRRWLLSEAEAFRADLARALPPAEAPARS